MLLPREKPYLDGLNSYYLHMERFIEHLQGEIGAGGLHCQSPTQEMMVYFNEYEVISNLLQKKDQAAIFVASHEIVRSALSSAIYSVRVFQLDAHAIFFWAEMQPFQRAKASLKSTEIPLPDLIFRLKQRQFSGFIDVQLLKKNEGGTLFFSEGERVGGSYTWGKGGMSTSDEDYNSLLSRIQLNEGAFTFGTFLKE
ncbi:MAG: hypothetical protein FWG62_10020 [Proteobacteria bacterium]|nr:hypothetical protein [Pseudomonadota bacterium]